MSTFPKNTMRGYTLLEMIVSLAIFAMVMVIVMGAYLTLISLDRHSRSTNQLTASLSFVVESMARTIRTGTHYCDTLITGVSTCTSNSFSFVNADGVAQTYLITSGGLIGTCTGGCTPSTASPLTDPRIHISGLNFKTRGTVAGDEKQPQVLFTVRGYIDTDQGKTVDFSIQSTATQRLIDI